MVNGVPVSVILATQFKSFLFLPPRAQGRHETPRIQSFVIVAAGSRGPARFCGAVDFIYLLVIAPLINQGKMPKEMITATLDRAAGCIPWGIRIGGGQDRGRVLVLEKVRGLGSR